MDFDDFFFRSFLIIWHCFSLVFGYRENSQSRDDEFHSIQWQKLYYLFFKLS